MLENYIEPLIEKVGLFDGVFIVIMLYCILQSSSKGFTLSLISFMKWVLALILTIIFIPKLQPWVSNYIDSPFLNNIGLSIMFYVFSLFLIIIIGKGFSKSIRWTGFGAMDKTFGIFFGIFKGYVVAVCLFSVTNWFYPSSNWSIELDNSFSYKIVKSGSEIFINEFPNYEDIEETREKIENI